MKISRFNLNSRLGILVLMGFVGSFLGCGEQDPSWGISENEIGKIEQASYFDLDRKWVWSNPANYLRVCWENDAETMKASHDREKKWVKESVQRSWLQWAKVNTWDWGTCPSSGGHIRIRIKTGEGCPDGDQCGRHEGGANSYVGEDIYKKKDGIELNHTFTTWNEGCLFYKENCIKEIAVHEFGHALGFKHEHLRDEDKGQCNGDTDTSFQEIGPYDQDSVMNYCESWWDDYNLFKRTSPGDILGMQEAYARMPKGSLVGVGGRCLDVRGGNIVSGAALQTYYCKGSDNQNWENSSTGIKPKSASYGMKARVTSMAQGTQATQTKFGVAYLA